MQKVKGKTKNKSNHYINNKQFLETIIQYKKDCRKAKREKKPKPVIPDYAGKCLMLIATNLSMKPNFISYTFRDEMIGDAIENCCQYFDNFNPTKYKNPFAYFTQITWYAFLRRIHKEKKQLYAKYKAHEQIGVLGELDGIGEDHVANQFQIYENISEFIETYEKKNNKSTVKKVKKT